VPRVNHEINAEWTWDSEVRSPGPPTWATALMRVH
jgi:hypothetical protein